MGMSDQPKFKHHGTLSSGTTQPKKYTSKLVGARTGRPAEKSDFPNEPLVKPPEMDMSDAAKLREKQRQAKINKGLGYRSGTSLDQAVQDLGDTTVRAYRKWKYRK